MRLFVLIHSPLCGPTTWAPVAQALHARGYAAIVPDLSDDERDARPLWRQQAESVARALTDVSVEMPAIWVAHSGAGLRLPAYRSCVANPAQAYLFVDAGVPHDVPPGGMSQLDMMTRAGDAFAAGLRAHLEAGGRFPEWTDVTLRESIPDAALRARMLAELRPRGLRYFTEPLPAFAGWPDAPCAYLQFQPAYEADKQFALQSGWPVREIPAGHFHMLVEPERVAKALLALAPAAR